MKFFSAFFKIFNSQVDYLLSLLVIPAAKILLVYRRAGSGRFPKSTESLKKIGVFPIIDHYYEPLFNNKLLLKPLEADRYLPGINMNISGQLELLSMLKFRDELINLNLSTSIKDDSSFNFNNGNFESGDADFLYQFIRYLKPQKIVEIGSGSSTKIARLALHKNQAESENICTHICVEPYEQPWLETLAGINVIRERIEVCKFDWANELQPGDLLFVDSSHIIRPQGDVLKEYLEIFPLLKSGVFVHIHDIFTPKDYLKTWLVDEVKFWNEQYLLEGLLTNTNRYEIVAALNYLKHSHYQLLSEVCPYLTEEREPGSFYLKIK